MWEWREALALTEPDRTSLPPLPELGRQEEQSKERSSYLPEVTP